MDMLRHLCSRFVIAVALLLAASGSATAEDPKTAADDTWISLSGTVVAAGPDSFRLDYGDGVITVEMDDFDFYAEGKQVLENDQVVVYGKIDNDLFERKKIEAGSVFVESLGTHFYANAADEEDFMTWTVATPIVVGRAEVTGEVTSVNGREFIVDAGVGRVQVDTSSMAFNPMDDSGFLKVGVGDQVKVSGSIDAGLFERHEIMADLIVKLNG